MAEKEGGFFSRLAKRQDSKVETKAGDQPNQEGPVKRGLFAKVRDRLTKTKTTLVAQTLSLLRRRGKIDDQLLDEIEECLISADVGVEQSMEMVEAIRERAKAEKPEQESLSEWLRTTFHDLVVEEIGTETEPLRLESPLNVILVVGVNGVGKTTTIGKLANRLRLEGKRVIVAAADTFRAAALDQIRIWSERSGSEIVSGAEGADPSSVVFTAIQKAKSTGADVVIVDTAGRLHNKSNLMRELEKFARVIAREVEGAPQETLLVLDASTGQNGLSQAKVFKEMVPLTGIVLTKLDGTAKGGVTIAVRKQLGIPVKFVGLGEGMDDLEPFVPTTFVDALFAEVEGDSQGV
jgi:fused signal recognition particle receptor